MFTASAIHHEIADRTRGGSGAVHALARPGGPRDARDARRLPDPTTAGDFRRRCDEVAIRQSQDLGHDVRRGGWAEQPDDFFDRAVSDMDGFLVETTGPCGQGMDRAHDGPGGYHPLGLTPANPGEVLGLVNRPGNRPAPAGAAAEVERAPAVCCPGGGRRVRLRGDTDFSQAEPLARWDTARRARFVFGAAAPNLVALAEPIPETSWRPLQRPPRSEVQTPPRARPDNVKEASVVRRGFEKSKLQSEQVAECKYRPAAGRTTYRTVVVRTNLSVGRGERALFGDARHFFSLTHDGGSEAAAVGFGAPGRGHQENVLAQWHGGVRALRAPVDNLTSNWAYTVMTARAGDRKAWWAWLLPEAPRRWQGQPRARKRGGRGREFPPFVSAFVRIPGQIVGAGRRLVYRLLPWNPHLPIFFRLVERLRR